MSRQSCTVCLPPDAPIKTLMITLWSRLGKHLLQPTPYPLLLRRQGEVLPRSLIASQVWDMNFDSDTNVIDVAVKRLRVKIDNDFEPKLIQTVRGVGYVLEVPDGN